MSNNCRYSGWPGAWCLDCGREDPLELWLADGNDPDTDEMPSVPDCPEPGSHRHDPYFHRPSREPE